MITAGVDVGFENVKIVILKDDNILASGQASSGGFNRSGSAEKLYRDLLKQAGIAASDIQNVIATGQGKWDAHFAKDTVVEPVADVKAANWLYPSARSVVDVGADQSRAVVFDAKGKILDAVLNLKCAAGIGMFLESLARLLDIPIEEMGRMSGGAGNQVAVNELCGVFAEIDTHWLIHNKTPKADIVQARHDAAATRINSLLNEKVTIEKDVVFIGGVARNPGVVKALQKCSGYKFLVPEQPEFAGALGTALIAAC